MNKQPINSKQIVVIGKERGGKTTWAHHYAKKYALSMGGVCVYNVGLPRDYSDFTYFDLMDFREHQDHIYTTQGKAAANAYRRNPDIFLFRYNDRVIHFKYFASLFLRQKMKCFSFSRKEDDEFFKAAYRYFSRTLMIVDDSRIFFSKGLSQGHQMLMNRKNHAGRSAHGYSQLGRGCDLMLMFHNLNRVNSEIWDFTTDLVLFDTISKPSLKELQDDDQRETLWKAWKKLKTMPPYSALHIPMKGQDYLKVSNASIKI